ncbi:MAG: class I SAM-dependent methyltransferase [Candidatus Eremiobacteraeota bacterium]|nr:class I SAM-dependent methyltransferase [Candidatus Eremiobacteraeota bacterium]
MFFDRSGLAALSDLQAPAYHPILAQLERVDADFLQSVPMFAHPQYRWHRDTLHTWSRAWEYAFMLHHINSECMKAPLPLHVIDFGSGSTFFPFAIARMGNTVLCFDNDPIGVADLQTASAVVSSGSGSVEARQNGETLPCDSLSANIAYSVSVLEHMPDPVPIIEEIYRVLKPGGLFILTMDLDVEGTSGVSPAHFEQLRAQLGERFTWEFAERTIHPLDVLTSKNSPWPRPGERKIRGLLYRNAGGELRPLLGGPSPGVLTVYGCVLRRR